MAFYEGGLMPAHDPRYGINHKYIVKNLTLSNWKKRAVIRSGRYLYVHLYKKYVPKVRDNIELVYRINGSPKKHRQSKDYKSLIWAIKAVNNYGNGIEGKWPRQSGGIVKVFTPWNSMSPIQKRFSTISNKEYRDIMRKVKNRRKC